MGVAIPKNMLISEKESTHIKETLMQTFNMDNISHILWDFYQKKVKTPVIKIDGPFEVETSEGKLLCQDGYLYLDTRGYPYPVATDEFPLIFDPV